jgi:hypothetical protein
MAAQPVDTGRPLFQFAGYTSRNRLQEREELVEK